MTGIARSWWLLERAAVVPMRLRVCRRCDHVECPCCRDFCDVHPCVFGDNGDNTLVPRDRDGDRTDRCTGSCVYDQPIDAAGYARLDAIEGTQVLPVLTTIRGVGVRVEWEREEAEVMP